MTDLRLKSYLGGAWQTGARDGATLLDAGTGALVATIDASGLDMAGALDWARAHGARLRAMTFYQRAAMLKALGLHLNDHLAEFHALSLATGATPRDGVMDIEGGIQTLFAYAGKGKRELPNAGMLVEGDIEPLSRDGSFVAQHVLTPLHGVAVHINAFNFPCWGMLEKLAPTLLAGMPAIVKPASQTAYLTEAMVRRIVQSGILPEGALQLICGSVGDLLDHVTGQDVVTFTGSALTGQRLRAHPRLIAQATRFTMEADSLNACVLGPDAVAGTPEFDLFVTEVVREMTVKAGQKCTAIRRMMVPRTQVQAVAEALAQALARVPLGLPGDPAARMGALASLAQRDEVRARIRDLAQECEVLIGAPEAVTLISGDPDVGAFVNPVVLFCARPFGAKSVHEVEAFGPVSTLMPYDDLDEAIALTHLGNGSLVASVFTHDPAVARAAVIGMAPMHGRLLIGNRTSAATSTGHGAPLPALVHGGPGRAGGGEELGGMRGVKHFLQRTAVQGAPELLAAVTGRWIEGAPTRTDIHPFRRSLADLRLGDQLITASRQVTLDDIEHFAHFTGDRFYAHMDDDAARANPFFDGRVAHGYLIVSFAAGLFVQPDPGPVLANYGIDNLRFLTPVKPGDTLAVRLTCKQINPRDGADHGEVRWDCQVTNQNSAVVAHYDVLTMVAKTWPD